MAGAQQQFLQISNIQKTSTAPQNALSKKITNQDALPKSEESGLAM
jgi:hypothetical protein